MIEGTRLSTGIEKLDEVLQGGIPSGSLVEILAQTYATADILCYHMTNMMTKQGKRTIWLDCQDGYSPEKVRLIAQRYNLEPETAVQNIGVAKIFHWHQVIEIIDYLHDYCEDRMVGLLIINSSTPMIAFENDFHIAKTIALGNELIPIIDDSQRDISRLRTELSTLIRRTGITCVVVREADAVSFAPDRSDLWDVSLKIFKSSTAEGGQSAMEVSVS